LLQIDINDFARECPFLFQFVSFDLAAYENFQRNGNASPLSDLVSSKKKLYLSIAEVSLSASRRVPSADVTNFSVQSFHFVVVVCAS
jgi:hypothetical protein